MKLALHTQMAIGFVVGTVGGMVCWTLAGDAAWLQLLIDYLTQPVGELFRRRLFMLVVALVFSALVLGFVEIGDPRSSWCRSFTGYVPHHPERDRRPGRCGGHRAW